jgi:hypothetical protein
LVDVTLTQQSISGPSSPSWFFSQSGCPTSFQDICKLAVLAEITDDSFFGPSQKERKRKYEKLDE